MKKLLLSIILLSQFSIFSQQRMGTGFSVIYGKQRLDLTKSVVEKGSEASGTQYLNESFLPTNVVGYDGTFLLRYNAYKDEMEFQSENEVHYLVKSDSLEIFFLNSKKRYRYLEYSVDKESIKGFLVLLNVNEKISLFKREKIKLIPTVYASNAYKSDVPAHFELIKDTYFIKKENDIVPFPKNKKELVKMFPDKEKEILDFIKANDISFSKEIDLITLVKFLNTL